MIVTVTLNAALDRTLRVPNFQLGRRNRANASLSLPGGKGVNVARSLKILGRPVIATGLAGGRTGTQIIEQLTAEGMLNDFVRIRDDSRASMAVIDATNTQQTEINEHGPEVQADELEMLLSKVRYLSQGADMFVLAGSLPPNVPTDHYAALLAELRRHKVVTALDAAGQVLREALAGEPSIVSPNMFEAEEIVGHEFADEDDMVEGAAAITGMGPGGVLIHHDDGCIARLRPDVGRGWLTYRARLPRRTDVVSTVGSGDAFLAGFLSGRYMGEGHESCLARAVACGAASTQSFGAGTFGLGDVDALVRQVEVTALG